ncbi:MAG: hypothetical protein IKR04_04335 [Clostridia bacterium]|nr:hypothetical protein [Clostridia bacterium]
MGIGMVSVPSTSFAASFLFNTAVGAFLDAFVAIILGMFICLFIVLPTLFMKMKSKDRAVIAVLNFMFAFIDYFIIKFLGLISMNYITEIISVILLIVIPIMIETFVYNRVLTYKRIRGLPLALITIIGGFLILISVCYLVAILNLFVL